MTLHSELSLTAQTAYLQLLQSAVAMSHARTVADLPGSFAGKTVKGRRYWYYQFTQPSGKLQQLYVGPDSEAVRSLINGRHQPSAKETLGPLARSASILGCAETLPRHLRVLRRLADYGFFAAGGVLVGTHAYLALGNVLGVRWNQALRTQDVDLAHPGKSLSLALPATINVNTVEALDSLKLGLLPVTELGGAVGASWLNPRDPEFRLDFLTTLHRAGDEPYRHPQLNVVLQPLRFMDFLLEEVDQAVLFSGEMSVVLNLPSPARFALHKLLVAAERRGAFQVKAIKDVAQAAALFSVLRERQAVEVSALWREMLARGPGWQERAAQGVSMLSRAYPELELQDWLPV
jgi:hypothetical protein